MQDASLIPIAAPGSACERADAARNRALVLDAARQIVERSGVEALTMQAVADTAGVGKGTIFRRFSDRAGLLHALLDDDERAFQQDLIGGPPPLGPGAGPAERLVAFGLARIAFVVRHGDVLRAATEHHCGGPEHPVHAAHRLHLRLLLASAGVGPDDAAYLASALLAALDAATVLDQLGRDGLSHEQVASGWDLLARAAATAPAS
ncbi:MAG: helix-turn-helix domain-containing protein [Baekduia sp.]